MCGETPQIGSACSASSDAPQRSGWDRAEPCSAGACSNPRAVGLPLLSPPRRPLPRPLPCARRRSCCTPIPAHARVAHAQSYTRPINPKRHHKQNNSYVLAETRCSPRVSSSFRRRALAHTGEPFPEGRLKTLFHITETFPDRDPVPPKSVCRCRHTSSLPMRAGTELPRRPPPNPLPAHAAYTQAWRFLTPPLLSLPSRHWSLHTHTRSPLAGISLCARPSADSHPHPCLSTLHPDGDTLTRVHTRSRCSTLPAACTLTLGVMHVSGALAVCAPVSERSVPTSTPRQLRRGLLPVGTLAPLSPAW